ncbi:MAG: response regulator [Burkholderiales bacterium]
MRQGTVYVVDDDASLRRRLVRILESWGYATVAHADAASFLIAADDDAPTCALVDARLPDTPGLAVIAALRDARVDLPVILMTDQPSVPDCVRAMREGAIDFLPKPLREDELLDAVRIAHLSSLEAHRLRGESRRAMDLLARLTVREREVLALVLEGRRNKEIAAALASQEATVKVHRSRLMRKLCVRSVPELVQLAECGRLEAPVRRDRDAPAGMPLAAYPSRAPGTTHESRARSAWLAANGSWSGFTWTRRLSGTRLPDA